MISKNTNPLDQEEMDLQNELENVDLNSIEKPNFEISNKFKLASSNYIKSETKMNIRIDPLELAEIKKKAAFEGLKYQSFVKSILHKYVTGQLIERKVG